MSVRDIVGVTIALGCTVAMGVSAYRLLGSRPRASPEAEFQPRVCDVCGHAFLGPPEPVVTDCPACKNHEAVRACRNQCPKCGETFDSYYCRYRDTSLTREDVARIRASGPEPELEYRRPGGEWGPYESLSGQMECPQCGGRLLPYTP